MVFKNTILFCNDLHYLKLYKCYTFWENSVNQQQFWNIDYESDDYWSNFIIILKLCNKKSNGNRKKSI